MIMQEGGDSNNGGCSGDRPKKAKPNKIPQRGLGIAALEKLRREEQQSRIAATHTATGADGSSSSEHSATGIIFNSLQQQLSPASPFLPVLNPNSNFRPLFIGNYPLFNPALDPGDGSPPLIWNSVQSDLRLPHVPRKQLPTVPEHQRQQRYSVVLNLSIVLFIYTHCCFTTKCLILCLRAGEQELASTAFLDWSQSSDRAPFKPKLCQHESLTEAWGEEGGTSRPLMITQATNPAQLTDSDSVIVHGRELKIPALSREDASNSTGLRRTDCGRNAEAEQDGAVVLDGSFLSLSSAPSSTRQHYFLPLQSSRIQKNAPEAADAMQPPSLYNFMGLPDDLIGSKTGDADVNQKMTL